MAYEKEGPLRPEIAEEMRELAMYINRILPTTHGFALFVFDMGEGGHINYISNSNREDMVKTLMEFLEKWKGSAS